MKLRPIHTRHNKILLKYEHAYGRFQIRSFHVCFDSLFMLTRDFNNYPVDIDLNRNSKKKKKNVFLFVLSLVLRSRIEHKNQDSILIRQTEFELIQTVIYYPPPIKSCLNFIPIRTLEYLPATLRWCHTSYEEIHVFTNKY